MTAPVLTAPAPEIVVPEPFVLEIRAYRREELEKKLATANKRLARSGIHDQSFSAQYEPFTRKVRRGAIELPDGTLFGGVEVLENWLRVTLSDISISTGHYVFVAALVAEEAGYTVHCAPGQSLDGWQRPPVDDIHCDHCNLRRDRRRLYIIRDERDGSLAQIGHSCIELYTGLKIKGLWALEFDQQLRGFSEDDESYGGSREYSAPVNIVLGLAFAFSDEGRSYVSVRAAECGVGEATGGLVRSTIFYPPRPPQSRDPRVQAAWREYCDKVRQGYEFAKDEALMSDIIASAETLRAGTDYADNMHVILAGESGYVSERNVGILASLVAVYAREKELAVKREQEKKAPPASGYLAPVKQRVKDIELALTTVRQFEGHYGWTTLLVGRTPDQHVVKWFASGRHDYEPGDTVKLAAATVKAHEVWEGIDQTVITRGKFAA